LSLAGHFLYKKWSIGLHKWLLLKGKHTLVVEFENDQVIVQLDKTLTVKAENLSRQKVGRILLAAYCTHVKVHSAELVCRDTIEWTEEW